MARTIEGVELERLIAKARHLALRSAEHERHLASLVNVTGHVPAVVAAVLTPAEDAAGAIAATEGSGARLSTVLRQVCIEAREDRQLVDSIVRELAGDLDAPLASTTPSQRVLVVDDCSDTRELVAEVLGASGFEVMTAANGLEGVLAAHNLRPTVILMDVTMPVLNGIEATRLLKSSAATRAVSVIAHTARPNFSDSAAVLFAGVLTKPVTPEKIVASVRELVDGTSAPE